MYILNIALYHVDNPVIKHLYKQDSVAHIRCVHHGMYIYQANCNVVHYSKDSVPYAVHYIYVRLLNKDAHVVPSVKLYYQNDSKNI